MTKQTTQELQAIVDGAPEGAETVDKGLDYFDAFGNHLDSFGVWTRNENTPQYPQSLDSIREILELRNKIESFEAIETDNHEYMDIQVTEIGKLESTVLELRKEVERLESENVNLAAEFDSALSLADNICNIKTMHARRDAYHAFMVDTKYETTLAIRDLEMQAKGVEDWVDVSKEITPTKYCSKHSFQHGIHLTMLDAHNKAKQLRQQAKELK